MALVCVLKLASIVVQVRDEFHVTVKMSTYLVCFVVCDFAHVTNVTSSNVSVSVYAPATIIHQADYALHSAITLLEYYQQFFTVPYPLPKLGTTSSSLLCSTHCLN